MICQNCGKENIETADICIYCGQILSEENPSTPVGSLAELDPESFTDSDQGLNKDEDVSIEVEAEVEPEVFIDQEQDKPDQPEELDVTVQEGEAIKRRSSARMLVLGIIIIVALIAVGIVAIVGFDIQIGSSQRYLVGGGENLEFFKTIYSFDGKTLEILVESVEDRRFMVPPSNMGPKSYFQSPDGENLVLFDCGIEGCNLALYTSAGELINSFPTYVEHQAFDIFNVVFGFYGFSPDSNYFGFSILNNELQQVDSLLINMDGEILHDIKNRVFGGFTNDSQEVILQSFDWREVDFDIELFGIETGDSRQASGEEMYQFFDQIFPIHPFMTNDDNFLYYSNGKSIYKVDINNIEPELVYPCVKEMCAAYYSPEIDQIVVLENIFNDSGKFVLFDPVSGESREYNEVKMVLNFSGSYDPMEEVVLFSPDGNNLSYLSSSTVIEGDTQPYHRLQVSDIIEEADQEIDDSENFFYQFAPDSRRLGYIELPRSSLGIGWGNLYIVDKDGEFPQRIERDVSSFLFTSGSRYMLYTLVSETNPGEYKTEIYKSRVNGENKNLLQGPTDGILTIIR